MLVRFGNLYYDRLSAIPSYLCTLLVLAFCLSSIYTTLCFVSQAARWSSVWPLLSALSGLAWSHPWSTFTTSKSFDYQLIFLHISPECPLRNMGKGFIGYWIPVLMLVVKGSVAIMSDVSGRKVRSKIPPNATARKFAVMTIKDARKWKIWPWQSAPSSMRTGGNICVFKT